MPRLFRTPYIYRVHLGDSSIFHIILVSTIVRLMHETFYLASLQIYNQAIPFEKTITTTAIAAPVSSK